VHVLTYFLGELMQWGYNGAKVLHKSTVETHKPYKTPHLCDRCVNRPAVYGLNLVLINFYFLRGHSISKKRDSIMAKCALLKVTK
jgi:hypothetical protein